MKNIPSQIENNLKKKDKAALNNESNNTPLRVNKNSINKGKVFLRSGDCGRVGS